MISLLSFTIILVGLITIVLDMDIVDLYRNLSISSSHSSSTHGNHFHLLKCPNLFNSFEYDSSSSQGVEEQVIHLTQASTEKIMELLEEEKLQQKYRRGRFGTSLFPFYRKKSGPGPQKSVGQNLCQSLERILKRQIMDEASYWPENNDSTKVYPATISITKIGTNNKKKNTTTTAFQRLLRGATYRIPKSSPLLQVIFKHQDQIGEKVNEIIFDMKQWMIVDGTEIMLEQQQQ